MRIVFEGVTFSLEDIENDRHARSYRDVLDRYPQECQMLIEVLKRPLSQLSMELAEERFELPSITGILKDIDRNAALKKASESLRFRQLAGDCVRILMEKRGWVGTGDKQSIRGWSPFYKRAERYKNERNVS